MTCPECGGECEREMVDIGVGEIAASPWGCPFCHWVEDDKGEAFFVEGDPHAD